MRNKKVYNTLFLLILLSILLLLTFNMQVWKFILHFLFPQTKQIIYPRATVLVLMTEHLKLVLISTLLALITGISLGIFVTREAGKDFLTVVSDLTALGQTFPPVAILALAIPIFGFGAKPTIIALFLYSILPVLRNTITGLNNIPPEIIDAATGLGYSPLQRLFKIELPIAFPIIMTGIRVSTVINIGTATLGAVVGAGGLGTPIIAGLVRNNPSFVMEGALAAALLAITADQLLARASGTFLH